MRLEAPTPPAPRDRGALGVPPPQAGEGTGTSACALLATLANGARSGAWWQRGGWAVVLARCRLQAVREPSEASRQTATCLPTLSRLRGRVAASEAQAAGRGCLPTTSLQPRRTTISASDNARQQRWIAISAPDDAPQPCPTTISDADNAPRRRWIAMSGAENTLRRGHPQGRALTHAP